jgi:glycerophosphoryl diester phosphodiesterase
MSVARNTPRWLVEAPIAHRGLHDNVTVPENSFAAFQATVRAGLPIELDVRLSADGRTVVFHDGDLRRLTGAEGAVEAVDCDTLRALRLLGTDEPLPLLAEVLEAVNGATPLLIELKSMPFTGELEAAVLKDLENYSGAFAVQSFNPRSVHYFKVHAPAICRGQLSGGRIGVPFAHLTQPDFVAYYVESLTKRFAARLRRGGRPLLAWTVTNAVQQARARELADNIIFEPAPDLMPHLSAFAPLESDALPLAVVPEPDVAAEPAASSGAA